MAASAIGTRELDMRFMLPPARIPHTSSATLCVERCTARDFARSALDCGGASHRFLGPGLWLSTHAAMIKGLTPTSGAKPDLRSIISAIVLSTPRRAIFHSEEVPRALSLLLLDFLGVLALPRDPRWHYGTTVTT